MILMPAQYAWLRKCRIMELGGFDSSLTKRSRYVPYWTKVKFKNKPTSLSDLPSKLNLSDRTTAELHAFHTWLHEQPPYLRGLPAIGDKAVDNHHEKLIERCEAEIRRLDTLVSQSWQREKAYAGLLFAGGLTPVLRPVDVGDRMCTALNTCF